MWLPIASPSLLLPPGSATGEATREDISDRIRIKLQRGARIRVCVSEIVKFSVPVFASKRSFSHDGRQGPSYSKLSRSYLNILNSEYVCFKKLPICNLHLGTELGTRKEQKLGCPSLEQARFGPGIDDLHCTRRSRRLRRCLSQ